MTKGTRYPNFDPLRNPLIYLEDLARSRDSDSEERSGKSSSSRKKKKDEAAEGKEMPALLSRDENYNPFTPKT